MKLSTPESLWSSCLELISKEITESDFSMWFANTRAVDLKDNVLIVQVPSKKYCEYIDANFPQAIRKAVYTVLGNKYKLGYALGKSEKIITNQDNKNITTTKKQNTQEGFKPKTIDKIEVEYVSNLNSKFVFNYFVVGESNEIAYSSAQTVSKNPGRTAFSPILIYGGVGLGKTHLAQAMGNKILDYFPDKKVLYIPSEKFVQQYVDAHKADKTTDFINFYQMVDVLIIDDIQFLSGKKGSQDIFFYIFNHLYQNAKQIILTADKAPIDMREIEDRLLSRFKAGLQVEVKMPDYSHRLNILRSKLERDEIEIPQDVTEYIARSLNCNIREIEGVVNSLIAQATFSKREINLDLAHEIVLQFVKTPRREITIEQIKQLVCSEMNVASYLLESKTRKREVVQARQVAMYLAKNLTSKYSLQQIGLEVAGRDHSTVLHSCKAVSNLIDTDKQFKLFMNQLTAKASLN